MKPSVLPVAIVPTPTDRLRVAVRDRDPADGIEAAFAATGIPSAG